MEKDPIKRFHEVFGRARTSDDELPERACLATAAADGWPSARMVLLKKADEHGFVFYTNVESQKGRELAENPRAALCFHWVAIGEQVRVQGTVEKVSDEEADAYFATRDRLSQVGSWTSKQSRKIESRDAVMRAFSALKLQYKSGPVPRPPYWTGYRIIPRRIEFWKNQPYRLHDRWLYTREGDGWKIVRLWP